jgi:hypothetical protein
MEYARLWYAMKRHTLFLPAILLKTAAPTALIHSWLPSDGS